ncbi:MAG: acyl-CoA carboxylase subunit beta [Zavarzinella sp.]
MRELRDIEAKIREGGGATAIERQHQKNRLTARERIAHLVQDDFEELGLWAAWDMYQDWGGAPSAGVITGIGKLADRSVMIIANDATVKAGAFFPMTCKKVLRAQRIAMENQLPLIYLVDSAGVFLPLQEDVFPDEDDFGRIFRNNAVISAKGIPQIAAIMGNCVAGGGYLPVLCDQLLMTEGSGLYLAGPALVKAAIGQQVSHEELGGATMHASISGTIDYHEPDDAACLERLRRLVSNLPADPTLPYVPHELPRGTNWKKFTEQKEYDCRELIAAIADQGSVFDEYKQEYGQSLVCGTTHVGGIAVGIVANQRQHTKPAHGAMQYGGVIYAESADKAARFILVCNQQRLPIIFLQNVNGFMVGKEAEQSGIIRSGAKLVNAISNSVVPKITLITGGSFGAGNYAMCGKAFDPRFIAAWPDARYAVMGADQAVATLLDIQIAALKRAGKEPEGTELADLAEKVRESYQQKTDICYAAARLWVDAIIAPEDTRTRLIRYLQIACRNPGSAPLQTGVLQV